MNENDLIRTVGHTGTIVLLAVLDQRRPTVRGTARRTSLSVSTVHGHLIALRDAGLVTWEDGTRGTLRALVAPVPRPESTGAMWVALAVCMIVLAALGGAALGRLVEPSLPTEPETVTLTPEVTS